MNPEKDINAGSSPHAENDKKKNWLSDLIPGRPDRNLFKEGEDEAPIDKDRRFVSHDPYDEEGDEDYDDETTEGDNYFEKRDDSEQVRK